MRASRNAPSTRLAGGAIRALDDTSWSGAAAPTVERSTLERPQRSADPRHDAVPRALFRLRIVCPLAADLCLARMPMMEITTRSSMMVNAFANRVPIVWRIGYVTQDDILFPLVCDTGSTGGESAAAGPAQSRVERRHAAVP